MGRPIYETAQSLADERRIMAAVRQHTGRALYAAKMPMRYEIDYCLLDNDPETTTWAKCKAVCFAEVKCRPERELRKFPDYMIALSKIQAGFRLKQLTSKPFYLIVEFADGIHICRNPYEFCLDVAWGGRKDRGDSQDAEPCVYLPINLFVPLEIGG